MRDYRFVLFLLLIATPSFFPVHGGALGKGNEEMKGEIEEGNILGSRGISGNRKITNLQSDFPVQNLLKRIHQRSLEEDGEEEDEGGKPALLEEPHYPSFQRASWLLHLPGMQQLPGNPRKRTYVGLDFPDYVTEEGGQRRAGNINSAEGGRQRFYRKG